MPGTIKIIKIINNNSNKWRSCRGTYCICSKQSCYLSRPSKYWCVCPCICAAVSLGQRSFFVPWAEVNSENHNWSTCWKQMPELSRLKTLISSFNSFTSRGLDTESSCGGYASVFHTRLLSELLNPLKNTKRLKITEFHKNKSSYTKLLWALTSKPRIN